MGRRFIWLRVPSTLTVFYSAATTVIIDFNTDILSYQSSPPTCIPPSLVSCTPVLMHQAAATSRHSASATHGGEGGNGSSGDRGG